MKIITRLYLLLSLAISVVDLCCVETSVSSAKSSIKCRDRLFQCALVSKILDRECHGILRKIALRDGKIPNFPLERIPLTDSQRQYDMDFFMKSIAATVNCVNKNILRQRKFVKLVQDKRRSGIQLTKGEEEYFAMICEFYQTKNIDDLLIRVAPVPVSLAVAQAALESGFGKDRTIHSMNAYFGLARTKDKLISFDSLYKSAVAYAKTLNVNLCYREFRRQRAAMISNSQKIDGAKLSPSLKLYGTDKNYRNSVQKIIIFHGLASLDRPI
ncbi:MAG: glucosaminidase domain-containing protein [Holosporaceae bacterium]|jgi:Bax protein|nr:glucosaminidase domain-containing protein [Holosporaceae bacterium]